MVIDWKLVNCALAPWRCSQTLRCCIAGIGGAAHLQHCADQRADAGEPWRRRARARVHTTRPRRT